MPIKLIGRRTDFRGKTLWEVLGNLKNFGVGRIVARNMFQRYPEPSYIKIMKVEALPNCKPSYNEQRKVIALVEKTFRGLKQNTLVQMESVTYKADYILVPKQSETEFCQPIKTREMKILPFGMEFPPLLRQFVVRQMKMNTSSIKEPKMKIMYNKTGLKTYRVAKEGETPTEPEPSIGLGKPVAPRLYKDLKL